MKTKRTKSSQQWLDRQHADEFTKRSKLEGYRSRAVYKLLEIQNKERILLPGMTVVDIGAAPGGWSQLALEYVGETGKIIAIDILPIAPIDNVDIICGDFRDDLVLSLLRGKINNKVDVVLSDISPNLTGNAHVDMPSAIYLAELALDFARDVLRYNGCMLIKLFQGYGFDEYMAELRTCFTSVSLKKPKASRQESREIYALAKGYRG